jgi:hypothetical protein
MEGVVMRTITANDLRTKGVSTIENILAELSEAFISVYGKKLYVVVDIERFQYLRDCELDAALLEAKEDTEAGEEKPAERVEEHLRRKIL